MSAPPTEEALSQWRRDVNSGDPKVRRAAIDRVLDAYDSMCTLYRAQLAERDAEIARLKAELDALHKAANEQHKRDRSLQRCRDNSCVLGPPGGMGTNGGCRCGAEVLRMHVPQLRATIVDLRRLGDAMAGQTRAHRHLDGPAAAWRAYRAKEGK